MINHSLLPLAICLSLSLPVFATTGGRLHIENAQSSEITLYPDKALVKQDFAALPDDEGTLVLEGVEMDWRENGFSLAYVDGDQRYIPNNLWWRKGVLDRDAIYSRLIGHSVELMGGGINVPVQGELLVYGKGIGLVKGSNGRQYIVDWNDPQGVRMASREPVFTGKDYADYMVAEFGDQKPQGQLELSYLTHSLSYDGYYRLTKESDGQTRLERQLILKNKSSTGYKNATVRLVSGNTHGTSVNALSKSNGMVAFYSSKENDERVGELIVTSLPDIKKLGAYTNIQLTQYKQEKISLDKRYVLDVYGRSYDSQPSRLENPRTVLRFKAGSDLPAGRVEFFETNKAGVTLLNGGAWLPATLKGDDARLTLGEALTIKVARKKIDNQQEDGEWRTRWEMTVYNDQKIPVKFILNERDHNLLTLSDVEGGQLQGTSMIEVKVPAKSEQKVTYTATYGIKS